MQAHRFNNLNKSTTQRGSALIMLVLLASIVAFFLVVGNAALYSRALNNSAEKNKKEYIDNAKSKLENWYIKNAKLIDNAITPYVVTEAQLFEETGITPMYGARIAITPLIKVGLNPMLQYRNIAVWIPEFGTQDTAGNESKFDTNYIFQPNHSRVRYGIVSGETIEADLLTQSQNVMRKIALLLEQRAKAKLETDPVHNLSMNYFRALDCVNVNSEEIPCTTDINVSGWVPLSNDALNLRATSGVAQHLTTDAWGNNIEFNNSTNPAKISEIPYTAALRVITPWNTAIYLHSIQPIN